MERCAKELPIRTLSDMVGIPDDEERKVAHAADAMVSWADPVYLNGRQPLEVLFASQMYIHQVALGLAAERRANPGDDPPPHGRQGRRDRRPAHPGRGEGRDVLLVGQLRHDVFEHPERLDLSRNPNPHVGFGGGVHFCLGANLARAQLRAIFGELMRQLPDIQAGDPAYLAGNFIHGIRSMPCTF